jgi:hypothetical protein
MPSTGTESPRTRLLDTGTHASFKSKGRETPCPDFREAVSARSTLFPGSAYTYVVVMEIMVSEDVPDPGGCPKSSVSPYENEPCAQLVSDSHVSNPPSHLPNSAADEEQGGCLRYEHAQ